MNLECLEGVQIIVQNNIYLQLFSNVHATADIHKELQKNDTIY